MISSFGKDPLLCPKCKEDMFLWRIWHPEYGMIFDFSRDGFFEGVQKDNEKKIAKELQDKHLQIGLFRFNSPIGRFVFKMSSSFPFFLNGHNFNIFILFPDNPYKAFLLRKFFLYQFFLWVLFFHQFFSKVIVKAALQFFMPRVKQT